MHWTLPTLTVIAAWIGLSIQIARFHAHMVEHADRLTHHLAGVIRLATQDALNAITAQLRKAKDELTAKLADVQAQLDAAGVAEQVDLSELSAVAQALDDIVPDPAAEPSEPVESVEPVEPATPVE